MRAAACLLLVLALAGCLTSLAPSPQGAGGVLPRLDDVQEPAVDAHRARLWWESFVNAYPERVTGSPTNIRASEQLGADLQAAGYQVQILYYLPQNPDQTGGPSPAPAGIRAVVGVKPGATEPHHVVAWVAHYDSNRGTVYAAYDDGSGTAVAMELARDLAKYNNSKTLMPIFFDAEESGLVASQDFVQQALADKTSKFDMVIGHDMTGINCPGYDDWPMYQMVGENFADKLMPIEEALYKDQLKLDLGHADMATPTAQIEKHCVVLLNGHDRNSDERRFKEAGVPILRMAGGRKAAEYPAYHQVNDTIDYVYQFVNGPENYEKGLAMVVRTSYWNVVVFDRLPPLEGGS